MTSKYPMNPKQYEDLRSHFLSIAQHDPSAPVGSRYKVRVGNRSISGADTLELFHKYVERLTREGLLEQQLKELKPLVQSFSIRIDAIGQGDPVQIAQRIKQHLNSICNPKREDYGLLSVVDVTAMPIKEHAHVTT